MAFVQVNNASQTLKLAAFIVAFFSSFFSYSIELDYSKIESRSPKVDNTKVYDCTANTITGNNFLFGVDLSSCYDLAEAGYQTFADDLNSHYNDKDASISMSFDSSYFTALISWTHLKFAGTDSEYGIPRSNTYTGSFISNETDSLTKSCPPDSSPKFSIGRDLSGDGEIDSCFNPADIDAYLAEQREQKKDEEYCENLVLDSGNNSASDMCHTSSNGNSCNVQKVTTDGGGSYYKGVSSSAGGCYTSENPEYDDSGTGDAKDDCLYSNGVNYCEANRAKHCSTTVGVEICDDGCIDDGTNLYCDTSRHPDVGEGDSNYFDDNGTCSVISASSSRGFCEDNDGTWDETTDYQETTCPVGAGTCSVAVAGFCNSCFDAGGTWTPDPTATLTPEAKAQIETGALVKTGNDKLTQIEHGQRKVGEATQSTIKSGNAKVVAAIEALGDKLDKPSEEEKESFTTTTTTPDKSKINALFDDASKAALRAEIETIKTDITSSINSIRAEATSMMSITVPSSTGYQVRNLTLSQGSFDMSLNRFSEFFKALAMPIMLICSILAGFILLGGKN